MSGSAAFTSYPITVEVAQANNVAGEKVSIGVQNGSITVVSCVHANKEWRVTKAAKCEEAGSETLTCKKCETTFETRTINATGHQHTEVRNAAAATKTAEGYTGDTYCKDCGKMIAKGKTVAKLKSDPPATKPPVTNPPATKAPTTKAPDATKAPSATDEVRPSPSGVPEIISGKNAIFNKNSKVSLVFVSNADFSEFIRVEIDRKPLSEKDFTVKSGSTVVTVNPDCLSRLSVGKHTVSVISTGGSADTEFTVQEGSGNSGTATATPNPAPKEKSSAGLVVIVILLVLLAGGAGAFLFIKKRRDAE